MPRSKNLTKKSKQRLNRLKKNAKRLAAYSAAAAVTVVATGDRSATADEVIWPSVDAVVNTGAAADAIWFNVVNGNTAPAVGYTPAGTSMVNGDGRIRAAIFRPVSSNPYLFMQNSDANRGFVGPGANFDMLAAGDPIGSGQAFGIGPASGSVPTSDWVFPGSNKWANNVPGYVGLRFSIAGVAHYGWAEMTRWPGDAQGITIHRFGFNDTPGATSFAGGAAIPEPNSMMLLAAGAAGLGMYRRRRKAA